MNGIYGWYLLSFVSHPTPTHVKGIPNRDESPSPALLRTDTLLHPLLIITIAALHCFWPAEMLKINNSLLKVFSHFQFSQLEVWRRRGFSSVRCTENSDQASWHVCWLPVLAASLWTVIQTDGSWQWKLPSYCLNGNFCKVLTKFYNFVKWRAGSERSSSKWYLDISYNPRRTIFPTSKDGINSRGN